MNGLADFKEEDYDKIHIASLTPREIEAREMAENIYRSVGSLLQKLAAILDDTVSSKSVSKIGEVALKKQWVGLAEVRDTLYPAALENITSLAACRHLSAEEISSDYYNFCLEGTDVYGRRKKN